ncbi:MAG: phosphotransacetylase [Endomicrobia bacterium]|nr:phosphotransacetylase [Endomicrobiia bacterium]MCL2506689.1 phosphotransacetylase [Endomicrobiia bacterium]
MNVKAHIIELAKKVKGKVILPESSDIRVLKAAQMLVKDGVCGVILPAENVEEVKKNAASAGIDLSGVEIINIDRALLDDKKIEAFIAARTKKGMNPEDALNLLKNPIYYAMMYLKSGKCDACVCGAVADTADVLRAGIHVVGAAEGIKLVSSYFLMIPPENHKIVKEAVLFADCGVNPNPDAAGLKDIAVATVGNFQKLFPGREANAAFLSFSTKGSAKNETLDKIIEATALTQKYYEGQKGINVDGEMQFDAAVLPEIGKKKAPGSKVAGNANIFIFPDLNAGNIGYKMAERFGGFQAIGPLVQGLALPVSDLSRGCNADDIYLASAIMLLQK